MRESSDFLREYFMQTRREIDTEKSSRDQILNCVILAIGAVGFAIFQNQNSIALLAHPCALVMEFSILVTITALFWLRRKKLQQIADRWFVLQNILAKHFNEIAPKESLEAIVETGLKKTRYSRKDALVCVGVSFPIYGLMVFTMAQWWSAQTVALLFLLIVAGHLGVSWLLMGRAFCCSEPLATFRKHSEKAEQPAADDAAVPCV